MPYFKVAPGTDNFEGREEILATLEKELSRRTPGIPATRSIGLSGQAGIGKTQLAIQYAVRMKDRYRTVYFFDAQSENDLKASMESFYEYLLRKDDERLKSIARGNLQDKVRTVLDWFDAEKEWLLVYDAYDFQESKQPAQKGYRDNDPSGLAKQRFNPRTYFPQHSATGHIILVGRSLDVPHYTRSAVELEGLETSEAVQMLFKQSKIPLQPRASTRNSDSQYRCAETIVGELSNIPLFIDVAAKYIESNHMTMREFLSKLVEEKQNMRFASPQGILGKAFTIWQMPLERLQDRSGPMSLMRLFSFLDGTNISSSL